MDYVAITKFHCLMLKSDATALLASCRS